MTMRPFRPIRQGEMPEAAFINRTQQEINAAHVSADGPLEVSNGPAGQHITLKRETLNLRRFQLTEDLTAGGSAEANVLYFTESGTWDTLGELFTVHDSVGNGTGTILSSGEKGWATWCVDNDSGEGGWELVGDGNSAATTDSIMWLATNAALPAGTYANGTAGVGATFTVTATGTLTVDGVLTTLGMLILVKDQASGLQNGPYTVTTAGAGGVSAVLTRSSVDFVGKIYNVGPEGDRNKNTEWRCTNITAPTVGTTSITIVPVNFVTGQTSYGSSGTNTGNIRAASEVSSSVAGNARGIGSVDWQQFRDYAKYAATGNWSAILGGFNNTASGTASLAFGQTNEASGTAAVALNGTFLMATGSGATIVNGNTVEVSGTGSFMGNCQGTVTGGGVYTTRISGTRSFQGTTLYGVITGNYSGIVAGESIQITGSHSLASGNLHDVSGDYCFAVGSGNTASGDYAVAMGADCEAVADCTVATGWKSKARLLGMKAHAYGSVTSVGDMQVVDVILKNTTTNATPTKLWLNGTGATARLTIPSGYALLATVNIAAAKYGTTDFAHYIRKVAIANVAGTTALLGAVSTIGTDEESDAGYDVAITADDTNDALQIEVTGKASTTLYWMAHVQGIEIGY